MLRQETLAAPRVLITDATERSMLATSRGLAAAGYDVTAAAFGALAAGQWSRSCSDALQVTDPRVDAAGFVADLRRYLEHQRCAMLVPGSDFSLLAVSKGRDALDGLTRLGLPPHPAVERGFNREVLAAGAAAGGLSPAVAVRCTDVGEAVRAANELGFPVLLKSISTVEDRGASVAAGPNTRRIEDEQQLRSAVGFYGAAWLVQRLESGRTLSFGGVVAQGRLLGAGVSAYLRTWPPTAGNVSFSVTIEPPGGLERAVATLLEHVGWEGMFELELIETAGGDMIPIDLNPRPYGSMALAVASGANLPGIWCDWVCGRDPEPGLTDGSRAVARSHASPGSTQPTRSSPGRRYRWEDADLRHLVWQLRRRNYIAAARTIRPWPRVVHAYFRASDPLPFLVRVLALVRGKIRVRIGRRRA
jgi:predicted ATP-grasp superfamily ATP-dependent carboligase